MILCNTLGVLRYNVDRYHPKFDNFVCLCYPFIQKWSLSLKMIRYKDDDYMMRYNLGQILLSLILHDGFAKQIE